MSLRSLHHRERPWGVALRRVPVDSGAEELDGGEAQPLQAATSLGALFSLVFRKPKGQEEEEGGEGQQQQQQQQQQEGEGGAEGEEGADGAGAAAPPRPRLPFTVFASASAAQRAGLPGTGSIEYLPAPPSALDAGRALLCLRRAAHRLVSARFLKRAAILLALLLLLAPPEWLGGSTPAPVVARVRKAGLAELRAEEAARDYADFLVEAGPDMKHCVGRAAFPTTPPGPNTGIVYAAPSCSGGVGNQVSCAAAALAYSLEFNRCLVLAKIHPALDVTDRPQRPEDKPPRAQSSLRDTLFRHFWVQEQLYTDNVTEFQTSTSAEVQQPGLSMHYAPFRHPYMPDHWIALLRGSFMHYQYTWERRKDVQKWLRPHPDVTRYLLTKYPDLARGVVVQVKRHRPEDHDDRTFPFIVRDFPIPGTYYYRRSIEMLLEKSERKDLAYFVFSTEDYEWARTIPWLATLPGPLIFADQEDEVHQFYMMMLARGGVVCANMANCWWGAYLGIEKRPVFLPHHYYNAPGQEPMGILYPGDVHAIHSDNLRGEGPPPWYPRPWEFSPLVRVGVSGGRPAARAAHLTASPTPPPPAPTHAPSPLRAFFCRRASTSLRTGASQRPPACRLPRPTCGPPRARGRAPGPSFPPLLFILDAKKRPQSTPTQHHPSSTRGGIK